MKKNTAASKAAAAMGRRSAQVNKARMGEDAYTQRMRDIGRQGGKAPRKASK